MSGLPPTNRTQQGSELALQSDNELMLQVCDHCNTVLYPPRELCSRCLEENLSWRPVNARGTLLAHVELARSFEDWFSERTPWLLVTVRLQEGVSLICHAHASITRVQTSDSSKPVSVHVSICKDAGGSGVLVAMPESAAGEKFASLEAALGWPVAEDFGGRAV